MLLNKNRLQCNNICQTKCTVNKKVCKVIIDNERAENLCKVIIDNESAENLVSHVLVDHLKLKMEAHPSPYTIAWIKKGTDVKVTKVCRILISIGQSYKDEVLCDVVDMDCSHILLCRRWQYDVDAMHKGRSNIYVFTWNCKKIALLPSTDQDDQPKASKIQGKYVLFVSSAEFYDEIKENQSRRFIFQ